MSVPPIVAVERVEGNGFIFGQIKPACSSSNSVLKIVYTKKTVPSNRSFFGVKTKEKKTTMPVNLIRYHKLDEKNLSGRNRFLLVETTLSVIHRAMGCVATRSYEYSHADMLLTYL